MAAVRDSECYCVCFALIFLFEKIFIPVEHDAALEKWLDTTFAGLYAVKKEHCPENVAKVAELNC